MSPGLARGAEKAISMWRTRPSSPEATIWASAGGQRVVAVVEGLGHHQPRGGGRPGHRARLGGVGGEAASRRARACRRPGRPGSSDRAGRWAAGCTRRRCRDRPAVPRRKGGCGAGACLAAKAAARSGWRGPLPPATSTPGTRRAGRRRAAGVMRAAPSTPNRINRFPGSWRPGSAGPAPAGPCARPARRPPRPVDSARAGGPLWPHRTTPPPPGRRSPALRPCPC